MKTISKSITLITLWLFFIGVANAQKTPQKFSTYKPNWKSLEQHQTPEWFRNAKFGIYFHWGVYSYMGKGAWYSRQMYEQKSEGWGRDIRPYHLKTYGDSVQYHDFIPKFTAKYFDADDWAALFKQAGVKFVGPVAEHCDGFSNWDSKVNRYNVVNYGPHQDLVGELEKAIKAQGLKFVTTFHHSWEWGWYNLWSGLIDTTNTEFRDLYGEMTLPETFDSFRGGADASGQYKGKVNLKYSPSQKFVNTWKTKIYEVVDKYKPDHLWFDSRLFVIPEKDREEMVAHFYNKGLEWGKPVVLTYKNEDLPKGVGVLDLERGRMNEKTDFPWLTDDSYAWNSWSWRPDLELKTPQIIIDELVDIVSKNGCLLLNITPTCDGLIPDEMRSGLLEIGKWLKVNGEAVYNTRPFVTYGEGPTVLKANHFGGVQGHGVEYQPEDFRFTQNEDKLYIIQLAKPVPGKEYLLKSFANGNKAAKTKISGIRVLGSNEKIKWSQTNKGLMIISPLELPNNKAIVYKAKIEFK